MVTVPYRNIRFSFEGSDPLAPTSVSKLLQHQGRILEAENILGKRFDEIQNVGITTGPGTCFFEFLFRYLQQR